MKRTRKTRRLAAGAVMAAGLVVVPAVTQASVAGATTTHCKGPICHKKA
jgi:hypothetical protein